jgi:hypothetical protein
MWAVLVPIHGLMEIAAASAATERGSTFPPTFISPMQVPVEGESRLQEERGRQLSLGSHKTGYYARGRAEHLAR